MEISQPISELDWIPRPRILALQRLGIGTVEDLLNHFPRRYEDRHQFRDFPAEESDTPMCLCGEVVKTQVRRFGGWKKIFEVTLQQTNANALSQPLVCRWFNLHYVQKMIATGHQLVVFGKPRLRGKRICLDHPEFEVIEDDESERSIHFRPITPIYPATEGLSQRVLRALIYRVLDELSEEPLTTLLPEELTKYDQRRAIAAIHFPETWAERDAARQHLVLSEFFAMQMLIGSRKARSAEKLGAKHCGAGKLLDRFLKALPFDLTKAQKKVLDELRRDLSASQPMNRLLQGDVGSGKTVVATAAMLLAVEAGYQAALMAPTQVLAEQHYAVLRQWLEPLGMRLALRTGARQEESGPLPLFENSGEGDENAVSGSARLQRAGDGILPSRTSSPNGEFSQDARYSKRRLPHFEKPWAIYAVTTTTKYRRVLNPAARDVIVRAWRHFHNTRYELFAICVMPDHLHALFQPLPKGRDADGAPIFWSLSEIMRSLKSFTAREINRVEARMGEAVWEKETFDRFIRSDRDLAEKFEYIVSNPWRNGTVKSTEDYRWIWTQEMPNGPSESSPRQNVAAGTLQARAPQNSDAPQIIIGTHALLYDSVPFSNLGLVVIDEQHK
ncbi:MAG TPA: DEAD/DEAH box helicase, partial [Chthoniobacterales bacterium]|nr:DEAD/DEAH box helicase [Chthoniobacterales bacterium]